MTTTTYRSVYTGQEIDEAIAAMKAGNGITISNDFTGGTKKAASAELARILNLRLLNIENPTTLRELLAQVPDSHILTDTLYNRLNYLSTNFRGVFYNFGDRESKTFNERTSYTGNEICVVLDNGTGNAEIDGWDKISTKWKRIKLFGTGEFDPVTLGSAGSINLFGFKTASYSTMKIIVSASTDTQGQVQEALMTVIGGDVYLSIYGDVGNAQLFNITTSLDSGIATMSVTTLVPNVKIAAKQIAMI